MPIKFLSKSEKETFNFAKKFAKQLIGGEVLCLVGDLGAGKTIFTKGVAAGLKVKNIITSPTFVLMKNYQVSEHQQIKNLIHIDAYRLINGQQLLEIGVKDFLNQPENIVIIEWADRVRDILPKKTIEIIFKINKNNQRKVIIKNKKLR